MLGFGAMMGTLASGGVAQARPAAFSGCYAGNTGDMLFEGQCGSPAETAGSDRWDVTGFVGLSFSIGDGFNPHLDAGLRATNVTPSSFVSGSELNLSVSLVRGLGDAQLRLLAIAGSANAGGTDLLGNAGIGWDLGKNSLLLNAGLQVPYARGFLDYTISDQSLRAFLEANSYGKIQAVQDTLTCGAGTVLETPSQVADDWVRNYRGNGYSVDGDIFTGTIESNGTPVDQFSGGSPSSAFIDGTTCFSMHRLGPT